jgi:superfamily II DNA or RNA helicase
MHRTRLSALCLVPTRVLLDQWLREIGAHYRGPVGCYGDGVRRWAPLTIATFESAYRHMDRVDLVIVDEVHHFGGGLRDENNSEPRNSARTTAAPPGVATIRSAISATSRSGIGPRRLADP